MPAVIKQADLSAGGLLEAVGNAERERAATPTEAPLSEWEVTRIKPDYGSHLTTQVLLANSEEAKAALQVRLAPVCVFNGPLHLLSRSCSPTARNLHAHAL